VVPLAIDTILKLFRFRSAEAVNPTFATPVDEVLAHIIKLTAIFLGLLSVPVDPLFN